MNLSPSLYKTPAGILTYQALAGFHDEAVGADGQLRPHWGEFWGSLADLGLSELTRRWGEAKQLIRENGVTYNVYGDPRGMDRPWQLDPIPLLIAPDQARALTAGLIQRARLLERILDDLYGPQQSLRRGLLPPELVFEHPGYLRACQGLRVPGGRRLHLYAADIGRAHDGAILVLGDRTQAPSGAGYALENRIVLSRVLPDAFRDCHVQRLALFFRSFRDTLRAVAPHNRDNPRIVLLTPGPYNETYFEHAYLARYLGYTLCEGGDLTVRDAKVYLKLLGGLQPVDVILRRLDDDFCDPLELRGDSFLGVPGLVQAVRSGNVAVANALGSGLVETPALMAYLPALSRFFFGEDLILPSPPAWWCGEPQALDHVLANLPRMLIKSTFATAHCEPVFGDRLGRDQRQNLIERIRARPHLFFAQEQVALSTAPVLDRGRLQPRHVVVRVYLAAREDGFHVMPGGLTRATGSAESMVVSMQRGGGSKDTWVLSPGPVDTFSLLRATVQAVELSRGGSDLPSRAADNLYWLGRYVERAEGAVRLLRGIVARLTEKSGLADVPELPALLRALTRQTLSYPGFIGAGAEARLASPADEVLAIVFDTTRAGSLAATLKLLQRGAGTVRDRISTDMWRAISGLERKESNGKDATGNSREEHLSLGDVLDYLNRLISTLAAFGGLTTESMTRSQGWRFLDMGRRLERSLHTISLLRTTLVPAVGSDGPMLEALLEIADSAMTYRRRYLSHLQTAPVLDLLLADESNPRSLAYQLASLADHVDRLPQDAMVPGRRSDASIPGRSLENQLVLAARTTLRLADVDLLAQADSKGGRRRLDELLIQLEAGMPILSDALTRHYLSHLQPSRHLAAGSTDRTP